MSDTNHLTVNQVVENYGPIIAATQDGEIPSGEYVVAWNMNTTFWLFAQVDGLLYEVDVRNYDEEGYWSKQNSCIEKDAVFLAQDWLKEIADEENFELNEGR